MAIGWVEQRVAREQAAIAFLDARGFSVTRTGRAETVARFWVSGWSGDLSGSQLVEIATGYGFGGGAGAAVTVAQTAPATLSEDDVMSDDRKAITFNAEGNTLRAIQEMATRDGVSMARATANLLDEELNRMKVSPIEQLSDLHRFSLDDLFGELRRRCAENGPRLAEETARADAAERRLAVIAEAMSA